MEEACVMGNWVALALPREWAGHLQIADEDGPFGWEDSEQLAYVLQRERESMYMCVCTVYISRRLDTCCRSMSLSLRVFLKSVRNGDGSIAQVLSIHSFNGSITGIETGKVDECKSLWIPSVRITHDLWCLENHAKSTEYIVEKFLINFRVQIPNEDVRTYI